MNSIKQWERFAILGSDETILIIENDNLQSQREREIQKVGPGLVAF